MALGARNPLANPASLTRGTPASSAAGARLARVEVHDRLETALPVWAELEDSCPATLYQTRRFIRPWLATFGASVTPMIVIGFDMAGAPALLLPLGLERRNGLAIAGFLGGRLSNGNFPLLRPDISLDRRQVRDLLRQAATGARYRPDAFALVNQFQDFEGRANPLAQLARQASPSLSHAARLIRDPAQFMAGRLSGPAARKLRNKRLKLASLGQLEHVSPHHAEETHAILDAFFAQKIARLRAQGITSEFDQPEMRSFLERCCLPETPGVPAAIELHALRLDGRIIAVYGGGRAGTRFSALFNSYDSATDVARYSPGDLLAQDLIAQKCREGLTHMDLGIGEARYKEMWCDEAMQLFDTFVANTLAGRLYGLLASARNHAKRQVKQSAWAWNLYKRIRAT